MNQPLLQLRGLNCGYHALKVVQDLDLHLNAGDIGCLLGPSGCGKTTTLRAIAGFEPVLEGEIVLDGEVISRAGFTLAPEKRHPSTLRYSSGKCVASVEYCPFLPSSRGCSHTICCPSNPVTRLLVSRTRISFPTCSYGTE